MFKRSKIKNLNFKKKKSAFTLSEVLITVGIVGIVAALTIPTLKLKYQKNQILSGLRKNYAMLQAMFQKAEADNGPISGWGLVGNAASATNLYNILSPYLNVSKYCGLVNPPTDCWAYGYDIDGTDGSIYPRSGCLYAILNDGTSFAFRELSTANNPYVLIYIDINGLKTPNKWGIDRFRFIIYNNSNYKIAPLGTDVLFSGNRPSEAACWDSAADGGNYTPAGSGITCAYSIITINNWQLSDENPYW